MWLKRFNQSLQRLPVLHWAKFWPTEPTLLQLVSKKCHSLPDLLSQLTRLQEVKHRYKRFRWRFKSKRKVLVEVIEFLNYRKES